jgi:selenocysteine-specific elongation factor
MDGEAHQDVAGEVTRRGAVRRSLLRRLGVGSGSPSADAVVAGDWLVSGPQLTAWHEALVVATQAVPDGMSPESASRTVGLPDPGLLRTLIREPLGIKAGRVVVDAPLPEEVRAALDSLRADLADAPFRAPDADRLTALGLDRAGVARLVRDGHLLSLGDGVVLLPGADDTAYAALATLPQPFTAGQARRTLETSRRVALPLLAHLDRTGRTVRLPDDTRRVVTRR